MQYSSTVSREIRDYFLCPICKNYFKEPTTCVCGHTFCMECLTGHKKSQSQYTALQCPVCKAKVKEIGERNIIIENLIASLIAEVANKRKEKGNWLFSRRNILGQKGNSKGTI